MDGWGYIAELVSVIDFSKYVLGNGFSLFVNVASRHEFFVGVNVCICDDVSFLVYIVRWGVLSEFLVYPACVICPECFIEINESFLLVGFLVLMEYESGGKNG